ncbi:NAD(P)/FAD-dependent oxidoreductase [Ornithinibacillus californiensis]|uniref:NAD(P)/FAD-dependent oxidoreductase n=1 Tax=Ornithinibacillus californiensis TaxID=161536 RepID=UPI00064D9B7D|nr:FAD-dependent oxidoreductase [Ornithinibacillus californiensis]
MKELTCVVIGGGYAGIHAVKAIQKRLQNKQALRVILINAKPYHVKKVLLFKPAAQETPIKVPLKQIFPEDVDIVQGNVFSVDYIKKSIAIRNDKEEQQQINYDFLVIAAGSSFQQLIEVRGGISLSSYENAQRIRQQWLNNLRIAKETKDPMERKRLLTIAVAGAGISGIETSAYLAEQVRNTAESNDFNLEEVRVLLINSKERLFVDGPKKLSGKLEKRLNKLGVKVIHDEKVVRVKEGKVDLENGNSIPTGLCIWTTGLIPNPNLASWGLPLTEDGRLVVDSSYRVKGMDSIYSIGDCARIIDPSTGVEDKMTCKEATIQARRLGKVIRADIYQKKAPVHQTPITTYCFGLGEKKGLVWVALPKLDLYLSGKIGYWIRKTTWDIASLVK